MLKEFIPYEQALELKELGFDEPCMAFYEPNNKEVMVVGEPQRYNDPSLLRLKDFCAPLYQQAFRWFRDKYNLLADITIDANKRSNIDCWMYDVVYLDKNSYSHSKETYNTYEEAELTCLKKLIELAKIKS